MSSHKRVLTGVVVSAKMQKTVVVKIETFKVHPIYHKRIRLSKKYSVHDEAGAAKPGDIVEIVESRPLSKTKRFTLGKVVKAAAGRIEVNA